jgi:hypothetical protein
MTLTRRQWCAIAILSAVMALDALISINGAWNSNATFYEANPLFAAFRTFELYSLAVIVLKAIAIGLTALIISTLNKEPGEPWGDLAAMGAAFSFTVLFITMAGINLVI